MNLGFPSMATNVQYTDQKPFSDKATQTTWDVIDQLDQLLEFLFKKGAGLQ